MSKNNIKQEIYRSRYLLLMLLPGLIYAAVFHYAPMYGVTIALKQFHPLKGIMGSPWVGLKHFRNMFDSMMFWRVFKNTLIINIFQLVFGFPAPLILALVLNELRNQTMKRVIQSFSYLPHFISWVILGTMVIELLSPSGGIINEIRRILGREPIFFLVEQKYFRGVLVMSAIWKEIGWGTIIYLAALSNIDPYLYEASIMDGANRWKQTLHITLPGIIPTAIVLLILRLGKMLDSNFDQIYVLYSPSVYQVGDVISTYIYRIGIGQAKYSETTAIGLFNSLIATTLIVSANKLSRRFNEMSMW